MVLSRTASVDFQSFPWYGQIFEHRLRCHNGLAIYHLCRVEQTYQRIREELLALHRVVERLCVAVLSRYFNEN